MPFPPNLRNLRNLWLPNSERGRRPYRLEAHATLLSPSISLSGGEPLRPAATRDGQLQLKAS